MEQLLLLDATFALVPPDHLQHVVEDRPAGLHMVSQAGRGCSASYMGGLNPMYDPTRILITYGALWENRALGICPTVFHEIGHVMTSHGLSYAHFESARAAALRSAEVSRNDGAAEALCNAYMYFLCYGSDSADIRGYGSGSSIRRDRVTRAGLRACAAFDQLPAEWQRRYVERGR